MQKKYKDKLLVQTAFRPDRLRDMTYSQFWILVEENQVQRARFSYDKRNVFVTTKPTAPGGQRTEMVGLPPDPKLMDHLTAHGVFVQEPRDLSVVEDFLLGIMRIGIPASVGLALFYSSSKIGLLAEDKVSYRSINRLGRTDEMRSALSEWLPFSRDFERRKLTRDARSDFFSEQTFFFSFGSKRHRTLRWSPLGRSKPASRTSPVLT